MNTLTWIPFLSLAGAIACALLGPRQATAVRAVALATAGIGLLLGLVAAVGFTPGTTVSLLDLPWVPALGIRLQLAADGISLSLCLLTGLAAVAGILFSWNITHRVNEFFGLFLALIGGVYGVFLSSDAFLFFVFYEIAIVPKYFLIANWGSTQREYGAMKLVLYSFAGSALVLAGLLWAYAASGANSFSLSALAAASYTPSQQIGLFALTFFGFAALAGLFPLHTWAPTGHVAAPTGASMLLAGVVMKLGAYGCLRVALPLFPEGFAYWQPVLGALALVGILYAGLVALIQEDFKFVIAYSSVSHMGFVLLGLAAGNPQALGGAVLQMISHGIIAGLLFAVVGRIVYERTHTRSLRALQTVPLFRQLPGGAVLFTLAAFASMGLPGFSGFPAELSVLMGAWHHSPVWAGLAGLGIVFAGAFTLRVLLLSFFGSLQTTADSPAPYPALTWPEISGAVLLLSATVFLGLFPDVMLRWILPALQAPSFRPLFAGVLP